MKKVASIPIAYTLTDAAEAVALGDALKIGMPDNSVYPAR